MGKIWLIASMWVIFALNGSEGMEADTPKYLYKILSFRHFQATQNFKSVTLSSDDDAFIHFSKEDQLERIISKYWADASQFTILKIETSKLLGDLVFEANPGGTAKYYHLYRGSIPFGAIVEAKIIYQKPQAAETSCLEIVEVGDPVLRKPARALSTEEILSPEIQQLIQEMVATMRAAPGVGLAAPQIGKDLQLIVVEDMDHSHLTAEQLHERDRQKFPLQVIINPLLYIEEADTASFFEGCLSVPSLLGVVPRAKSVRVECLNEKGEPVTLQVKGWQARILQHEIDHLNATLFIDRAILPTLMTSENYTKVFKGKSVQEIMNSLSGERKSGG